MPQQTLSTLNTINVPSQAIGEVDSTALRVGGLPEAIDTYEDTDLEYDEPNADWRYNPETNNARYRYRPFAVIGRMLAIVLPFLSFAFGVWWDKITGNSLIKQKKRARQLIRILTKLGPAYIKIGQALSTRPDVVPPSYLEELTTLQDKIESFPNRVAFRFIEEELGKVVEHKVRPCAGNPMEQSHRKIKHLYYPTLGFGEFDAAQRFCWVVGEVGNFLRPRRRLEKFVCLKKRRQHFLKSFEELKVLFQAVCSPTG